jgi:hypothetical protein
MLLELFILEDEDNNSPQKCGKKIFLDVYTLKDETITLHRKVGAQLSNDAA